MRLSSAMRRTAATTALLLCAPGVWAASISGTVSNKTTGKPAAGDDVVLIRLAQGMQESTRTKSDAKGRFTLDVPDEGVHLIRVTHDKANYFHAVQPGATTADVEVFTAAAKVDGIVGEAEVMRIQTDETGKTLRVVENFFVKNDSDPPKTQFSERPFEFYLSHGAVVEGSAALGPGSMPVKASPVPLGDPDHYAFIFPIRPGETRFQITYSLPYSGSLQMGPRPVLQTDTVAIMLPKSMTFKAASALYSPVTEEVAAQTFVARGVAPSQPLEFTLTGTGQMPRDSQAAASGGGEQAGPTQAPEAAGATPDRTKFGGGLGNPVDPEGNNDPWAKYKWWILGGLGLILATGAGIMLKRTPAGADGAEALERRPAMPDSGATSLLGTLKEEMFALETDRQEGRVSDGEYAEQKAALDVVLRRALRRRETAGDVLAPEAAQIAAHGKDS